MGEAKSLFEMRVSLFDGGGIPSAALRVCRSYVLSAGASCRLLLLCLMGVVQVSGRCR